jgi:hypothetical protein
MRAAANSAHQLHASGMATRSESGPICSNQSNLRIVCNQIQKHATPIKYFWEIATSANGLTRQGY